ncbi:hypothetical protein KFK09_004094 [Dendrobium nobile]|uniref:Uncharacterized protein n=1 Tax=Dendrobium nobile TaxID=94219 RepID=A0A8T3BZD5_DENNO|nr:hypothetical protein KFK09_004091 [Dendrobium nobile]KAI0524712.1 hypothetical protein KFK09_004094 [Dendrobium nobile]
MPGIEWTEHLPYNGRFYLIWHRNSHLNRIKPNLSGYFSLVLSNLRSKTSTSQKDQLWSLHNGLP